MNTLIGIRGSFDTFHWTYKKITRRTANRQKRTMMTGEFQLYLLPPHDKGSIRIITQASKSIRPR
jgi:hypothetical protein